MTSSRAHAQRALYESGFLEQASEAGLRPGGLALTDRALRACALPAGARVVDVGCGAGITVEHLRRVHALRASGIDASRVLLGRAQRHDPGTPLARAAGADLPLRAGSADAIVMECSLSAMPSKEPVLRECARVVAAGGRLALTDLYARGTLAPAGRGAAGACCAGIMTRDELEAALARACFAVDVWEDHSRCLTELLGRLVLRHGSLAPFWERQGIAGGAVPQASEALRQMRPGYCLVVATKLPAREDGVPA